MRLGYKQAWDDLMTNTCFVLLRETVIAQNNRNKYPEKNFSCKKQLETPSHNTSRASNAAETHRNHRQLLHLMQMD